MAEYRRSDGPAKKSDEKDGERLQHANQRVGLREEELAEHQPRHLAVKQEIVPFDCRADRAGDQSVRQTFQWFRDHDVELPANPIRGTQLVWKIPTQSLIRDILRNPFYAGAYVWGRRPVTTVLVEGRLEKRQGALHRPDECRVFIPA